MTAFQMSSGMVRCLYGVAGAAILVLAWSILAAGSGETARFPAVPAIGNAIGENFWSSPVLVRSTLHPGGIASSLLRTASNVLVAVAIGLVLGFILGLMLARSARFERIWKAPVALAGTIPVLALYPFLTLWFGTSRLAMGGMVAFYSAITVVEAVRASAADAQNRWGDYASCLGATRSDLVRSVIIPATIPRTVATIRVALAFGWGFQALAEVLGGSNGVGRLVRALSNSTDTAGVIGVLVCLGILAVLMDAVVAGAAKWVNRWSEN